LGHKAQKDFTAVDQIISSCVVFVAVVATLADEDDDKKERHCDSLIMCIVTTLNEGLRNGGGIGDVLRKPSSTVCVVFMLPLF